MRAAGYCEYCRSHESFCIDPFVVDHIHPRVLGGTNALTNLAYSCGGCNTYKNMKIEAIDPLTGEIAALFHPRQQLWSEHFAWTEDFAHVNGLTASGRATVVALQLNRPAVVNLRRVLILVGKHPPMDLH